MNDILGIITEILDAAAIPYKEITTGELIGQPLFSITTDHRALTGHRDDTLRAIDLLVKKIAETRGVESRGFTIDVNGIRVKQVQEIETKAKMMAERARSFEYDVELAPMSSFERLVVHAALAGIPNIVTESQGEGRERRVVIRYQTQTAPQL